MPRYFFSTADGGQNIDDVGTVLADDAAARVEAIRYAGEVMSSEPAVLWDGTEFKVRVSREAGTRLFTIVCHAVDEV